MEYMRTKASIEKFVIIAMRDNFKHDNGYTVKINEAMMFDKEILAERKMVDLGIRGRVSRVIKSFELKEVL